MAPPGYRLRGEWNVRLIDSGAMVEAPFAGGRGSAVLAGRVSYTGPVLSLIVPTFRWATGTTRPARYDLSPRDTASKSSALARGTTPPTPRNTRSSSLTDRFAPSSASTRLSTSTFTDSTCAGTTASSKAIGATRCSSAAIGRASPTGRSTSSITWSEPDRSTGVSSTQNCGCGQAPTRCSNRSAKSLPTATSSRLRRATESRPGPPPARRPASSRRAITARRRGFGFGRRKDFTLGAYADVVWDVAPKLQITPGLPLICSFLAACGARCRPAGHGRVPLSKKLKVVHGLALVHQAPSFVGPVPGFSRRGRGLQRAGSRRAGGATAAAGLSARFALFQTTSSHDRSDQPDSAQDTESEKRGRHRHLRTGSTPRRRADDKTQPLRRLGGSFLQARAIAALHASPQRTATTDRSHVSTCRLVRPRQKMALGGRVLFSREFRRASPTSAARHPRETPPFWRLDFKLEKRWYIKRPGRWWASISRC